jgi:hypothetical protein
MLAGIRQIAYGLAIVVAGFLVVALANSIWAALVLDPPWSHGILLGNRGDVMGRAHAFALFAGYEPPPLVHDVPPWWPTVYAFGHHEAFIGVVVVMWLIGYAIRRIARSMSSGRPA